MHPLRQVSNHWWC